MENATLKAIAEDPVLFRAVCKLRGEHLRRIAGFAFRKGVDDAAERFRREADAVERVAGVRRAEG